MCDSLSFFEVAAALRHEGGKLYWLVERGSAHVGAEAGRVDRQGYVSLELQGHCLLAHRVVWLLVHGEWPVGLLDHCDRDRSNNTPSNLRLCTNAQNQANRPPRSGRFKGVVKHRGGKFQAQFRKRYLGLFESEEAAARAYDAAAVAHFGEFARPNFGSAA